MADWTEIEHAVIDDIMIKYRQVNHAQAREPLMGGVIKQGGLTADEGES